MSTACQSTRFLPSNLSIGLAAVALWALCFFCVRLGLAQMTLGSPLISTIAGSGTPGYSGDGGAATSAELIFPDGEAVDSSGNVYFTDVIHNRVRMVGPSGTIRTFAGNGTQGYIGDGGAATSAELNGPVSVATDTNGNLYIADFGNHVVRKVNSAGVITTVAGNGTPGYSGDGGAAVSAMLIEPAYVTADGSGNLYISDSVNHRVRKVAANGIITTFAGNGTAGYSGDGGVATSATLNSPAGLAVDSQGNLYIADSAAYVIRRVSASGNITTAVGTGTSGYNGEGILATGAEITAPEQLAIDNSGNLYMVLPNSHAVREVDASGYITTVAGGIQYGPGYNGDGIPAVSALLNDPFGVAVDSLGNVYIADSANARIRRVNVQNTIYFPNTTVGSSSSEVVSLVVTASERLSISSPSSEFVIASNSCNPPTPSSESADNVCNLNIYFAPATLGLRTAPLLVSTSIGNVSFTMIGTGGHAPVVAFSPGIINTVAGTAGRSGDGNNIAATSSGLNWDEDFAGVSVDILGDFFISDAQNCRIAKVDASGTLTTVAGSGTCGYSGDGGPATGAELNLPENVALDSSGNLYISDTGNCVVRKVSTNGNISTLAGNGNCGYGGDGGPATSANLASPIGVALDTSGNVYISDTNNSRVRKINPSGIITTVAGNGTPGFTGDGATAASAELDHPVSLAVDSSGNIYIADRENTRVREIYQGGTMPNISGTPTPGYIYTVVGSSDGGGYGGDGGPATSASISAISGLALDGIGNLYIADNKNSRVREVNASGIINTVAGNGTTGYSGDYGPATSAQFHFMGGVALDNLGDIYVGDTWNLVVREVTTSKSALAFSNPTYVGSYDAADGPLIVTVTNIGDAPLIFSTPYLDPNFAFDSSSTCLTSGSTYTLATGASCKYAIDFVPTVRGAILGALVLNDNNLNSSSATQTVSLTGSGR